MNSKLSKLFHRGQTGQSIMILALGFMALIGFVGIVTDVSLMFVRYSALRRAVDSASIAAAGQVRRDRNFANLNLSARQFIEFHGMSPQTVVANTCDSIPRDPDEPTYGDPEYVRLREILECDADQRKFVHVVAELESPTVFLGMLGWPSVTLQADAIAETAMLDVVIVMSVGESMLEDTLPSTWQNETVPDGSGVFAPLNQGIVYIPPRVDHIVQGYMTANSIPYPAEFSVTKETYWQTLLVAPGLHQQSVNNRLTYSNTPVANALDNAYRVSFVNSGGSQTEPRAECRVRFAPISRNLAVEGSLAATFMTEWNSRGDYSNFDTGAVSGNYDGFIPAYNFYGCCNDPNGDFLFRDLICQPMRDARDAAEDFLARIDFVRGDRVAFVTYDRTAHRIDPDGEDGPATVMIDTEEDALQALQDLIGVRAEPNFYWEDPLDYNNAGRPSNAPDGVADTDGTWDALAVNGFPVTSQYTDIDLDGNGTFEADIHNNYPIAGNCPFDNAALAFPFSRYASSGPSVPPIAHPSWTTSPRPDPNALQLIMNPRGNDLNGMAWSGEAHMPLSSDFTYLFSYEYWASCRGSNVGAALREGGGVLLDPDTVRRNGAVWVMVLLGDGAAGASDPVKETATGSSPRLANPYLSQLTQPDAGGFVGVGDYGAYGVCPYGTRNVNAELTEVESFPIRFPVCMDVFPQTRHFCGDISRADAVGTEEDYIDLGEDWSTDQNSCLYYDVDDYARDWADTIALDEEVSSGGTLLPTIFTIGYGLGFTEPGASVAEVCENNITDCLGEELLRYIADVGDNYQIDMDFQQDWLDNDELDNSVASYGSRGACEDQAAAAGTYAPLPAQESCGNYFFAPDEAALQDVFDQIASRMFTRLSR